MALSFPRPRPSSSQSSLRSSGIIHQLGDCEERIWEKSWTEVYILSDVGNEADNDGGYAANRMTDEFSMIGLDGIERYTSTDLELCIRN